MPMSPRLLRPRSSAVFNPRQISGLAGWWDADDSSTITIATGVSAWADKSGNGRTLTQTTANNQPARVLNDLNGKAVISFDGVNDTLGASFTLAQPCQHFIVFKYNAAYTSGGPRVFDGFGVTVSFWRTNTAEMRMNAGGSDRVTTGAPFSAASVENYNVWDVEWNSTSSLFRAAGVRQDTGSGTGTSSPGGIRLAIFNNGFSQPGNISIAEVLIYSRVLSAAEASAVRRYLGRKFNLAFA